MKKITKKTIAFIMLMIITFQAISPTIAFATTLNGSSIIINGSPSINGDQLRYEHGSIKITRKSGGNTTNPTSQTLSVETGDEITIQFYSDENYIGKLYDDNDQELALTNGSYTFTVGAGEIDDFIELTPTFVKDPSTIVKTYDFILNGKVFEGYGNGDILTVPDNFNMDSIEEFYIKNIYLDGVKTYEYDDNEYSYDLLDNQGRHILEINMSKTSDNYLKLRIQSHPSDIQNADLKQNRNQYPEFYIPEITLKKNAFRGVEVKTNAMPDSYDFTSWNGVDLSATDESNFGSVSVYYGEDTFSLLNDNIADISLVPDMGVPESAININNTTHKVTVLSNYYNEIPLRVELNDGTVGYFIVNRIGLFIGSLNPGNTEFYHGASSDVGNNLDIYTDQTRIVAVFYHENSKPGMDYKLIVNITYEDGSTETTIAEYVDDIDNSNGDIIGSDYILWKGNSASPVKVSVTAVDAEALTNPDNFGGATYGSGEGVVWERD